MHFKLNIRRYSPISHFHKIVNIMRLSLVLCMLTIFCASATVSYSQVNEISLHLEDATLEQALEAIKQQSEYSFWYRNDEINLGRKVSVNINNQNIANVLDRLPLKDWLIPLTKSILLFTKQTRKLLIL